MTMRTLGMAVLFATLAACGSTADSTPSAGNPSTLSGSGTADQSDGGTPDGGTADGGTSDASDGGAGTCDCSGLALPDVCMVCTDGQTACAHFVCEAGTCEVQICP